MVEKALGVEGDEILYVGDHIYTDAGKDPGFRLGFCSVPLPFPHQARIPDAPCRRHVSTLQNFHIVSHLLLCDHSN